MRLIATPKRKALTVRIITSTHVLGEASFRGIPLALPPEQTPPANSSPSRPADIFPNCTRATFLDYCLSLSSILLVSGALTLPFFVGLVLAFAAIIALRFPVVRCDRCHF